MYCQMHTCAGAGPRPVIGASPERGEQVMRDLMAFIRDNYQQPPSSCGCQPIDHSHILGSCTWPPLGSHPQLGQRVSCSDHPYSPAGGFVGLSPPESVCGRSPEGYHAVIPNVKHPLYSQLRWATEVMSTANGMMTYSYPFVEPAPDTRTIVTYSITGAGMNNKPAVRRSVPPDLFVSISGERVVWDSQRYHVGKCVITIRVPAVASPARLSVGAPRRRPRRRSQPTRISTSSPITPPAPTSEVKSAPAKPAGSSRSTGVSMSESARKPQASPEKREPVDLKSGRQTVSKTERSTRSDATFDPLGMDGLAVRIERGVVYREADSGVTMTETLDPPPKSVADVSSDDYLQSTVRAWELAERKIASKSKEEDTKDDWRPTNNNIKFPHEAASWQDAVILDTFAQAALEITTEFPQATGAKRDSLVTARADALIAAKLAAQRA